MNKLKLLFVMAFVALTLCACVEEKTTITDGVVMVDTRFDYYYTQECIFEYDGYYRCERAPWAISPSLTIVLSTAFDGYAEVTYQGRTYPFYSGSYDHTWDSYTNRYYYSFALGGGLYLTLYDDGSEAVFTDEIAGIETHYFYSPL